MGDGEIDEKKKGNWQGDLLELQDSKGMRFAAKFHEKSMTMLRSFITIPLNSLLAYQASDLSNQSISIFDIFPQTSQHQYLTSTWF
jgi:hypothetical protein